MKIFFPDAKCWNCVMIGICIDNPLARLPLFLSVLNFIVAAQVAPTH